MDEKGQREEKDSNCYLFQQSLHKKIICNYIKLGFV